MCFGRVKAWCHEKLHTTILRRVILPGNISILTKNGPRTKKAKKKVTEAVKNNPSGTRNLYKLVLCTWGNNQPYPILLKQRDHQGAGGRGPTPQEEGSGG